MALGGATLVLTLCLWGWLAPGPGLGELDSMTQMGAPANLVALIPEAARATVAAGYTSSDKETTTEHPPQVSVSITLGVATSPEEDTVPEKDTVLIMGDTHYAWQEWSEWHCNCAAGSMSRVRDITYSQPGVHLDPDKYDVLRFERVVCNYQLCKCDQGQCDLSALVCEQGPMHMCALQDIKQDKEDKRKDFWTQVHNGLRDLWKSIKDTFPPEQVGDRRAGRRGQGAA
ncbi:protein MENT-like [Zootoca vivipara]|uniref:protein MENT-like n=1 Tax=Zootoca vivipara TaxID=8524 RepID=UPI001591DAA7|nr:protein MENT-like [Zootoca vivipara]